MADTYLDTLDQFVQASRSDYETQLKQLVDVPTVSADPDHQKDIARGAGVAVGLFKDAGLAARTVATSGNPVVYGELIQDASYPTLLIYNHLDVQPADPNDWRTEPFDLMIDGERYIGRGATDDKGPALVALQAIRYARERKLPLNIKVVWELEEEIGSPHFEEFVRGSHDMLAADSVVISDTIWTKAGQPAIPVGLRGMVTFEVNLQTSEADTHSGLTGGAARNPIGEVAQILSECYDASTGKVHIPGFYDDVVSPTDAELDGFAASGFSVEGFMKDHGLRSMRSQDARDVVSRIMAQPTFEVHGIVGGYTGPGIKAIVPPSATAKVSTRLVSNQDPDTIFDSIKKFIQSKHPNVIVTKEATLQPYLAALDGPYAEAASAAMAFGFGTEPAFVREGGSIGAVVTMAQYLKVPIMMLGLSLPEQGYHAPNEFFDWGQASGGIKMYARYFQEVSKLRS